MSSTDFMPIEGWDHVELWVGNAKQAAYFYEHALGFTQTAYAGPETGVRDRASYVLDQGDIRLVVTSGLRPDSEITRFACSHGDGVKDVALQVPERDRGLPPGRPARRARRRRAALGRGRLRPRRAGVDRDLRRRHPHLRQPRRLRRAVPARATRRSTENGAPATGIGLQSARPRRRQRRARPHEALGRVLRARRSG